MYVLTVLGNVIEKYLILSCKIEGFPISGSSRKYGNRSLVPFLRSGIEGVRFLTIHNPFRVGRPGKYLRVNYTMNILSRQCTRTGSFRCNSRLPYLRSTNKWTKI